MRNCMNILFLLVVMLGLSGCRTPAGSDTILRYASPYSPNHPFSLADQEWMQYIESKSDGELSIKPYWGGALISSDMSMLELRNGVADIGLITPIYALGGAHMLRTQAGFYGGIDNIDDQVALYKCLAGQFTQFDKELAGLKVLAVQGGNLPEVLTREKPIRSLEDFKGLRLRVQSEAVEVLRQLGADPVNMPMGEVYSAMAKGVIDGVVAPADTLYSLHFSEVGKFFTTIRFSRGAYPARAMAMDTWEALPQNLKQIIEDGQAVWEAALKRELLKGQRKGYEFGAEQGVEFISVPAEDQREFDQLFNQVALQQARAVNALGFDAEPVFHSAQALIASGAPIQCHEEPTQ